jgi:WD40 repeat protein
LRRAFALVFLVAFILMPCLAQHGLPASGSGSNLQALIESKLDLENPSVEQTAVNMARDYPGEFSINQVEAIYNSLVQGWSYFSDPKFKESYKSANQSLQDGVKADMVGAGDCDDFAILIASLIESLGGSTRIIFSQDEETGGRHAYAELYIGKKDDPRLEDIKRLIRDDYGVKSVPGMRGEEDIWVNLDYNSSYMGGPFFGGGRATPKIAWMAGNKTTPNIIPLIDSMNSLSRWKVKNDDIGSNISIGLVPSKKDKAINLSYDLKKNGWVEIARDIDPVALAELKGLNLSYLSNGGQITLEIRLEDVNGTAFHLSRSILEDRPRWAYIEILFEDLKTIKRDSSSANDEMDPARISKLEFIIHESQKDDDIPGQGSITLGQIRGVMRIPKGSPWERAEEKQIESASLHLVTQAENLEDRPGNLMLGALLEAEALRMYPCWETDQALRSAMELMPRKVGTIKLGVLNDSGYPYTGPFRPRSFSISPPRLQAVAISSDGSRLAAANGSVLKLWDIKSRKQVREIREDGPIEDVAFSSDGSKLAIAGGYNVAKIYDFKTGRNLSLSHDQESDINSIAISEDGLIAATMDFGSNTGSWRIQSWDTRSGSKLADIPHDPEKVHYNKLPLFSFAFSPNGKILATGPTADNTIRLWDPLSGDLRGSLPLQARVLSLAFSHDGSKIAAASEDEKICVWDTASLAKIFEKPSNWWIIDMAFSPDGNRLATAGSDNTSRVWDIGSEKELARVEHDRPIRRVRFGEDGKRIVTASDDDTAKVWEMASAREMIDLKSDSPVRALSFSTKGPSLSAISYEEIPPETILVNAYGSDLTRQEIWFMGPLRIPGSRMGPVGRISTVGGKNNETVQLWDLKSGSLLFSKMFDASYSSIGGSTLFQSNLTALEVLDLLSGRNLSLLPEDGATLNLYLKCAAICPNESRLVTASDNLPDSYIPGQPPSEYTRGLAGRSLLQIWDLSSGKEKYRMPYHDGTIEFLAVTPDCSRLIAAGYDTIQVWDLLLHKQLSKTNYDSMPQSIAISPDGSKVAIANYNETALVLDALSFRELARFEHQGPVNAVAFSDNGLCLATGSNDKTARIWDIEHKKELVRLKHNSPVLAVAFSPDGSRLATACENRTVKIWLWRYTDLIVEVCSRLTRNLTQEEWHQYLGDELYQETCACKNCGAVEGQ